MPEQASQSPFAVPRAKTGEAGVQRLALRIALGLHGGVFAVALLGWLLSLLFQAEEPPHTFTLVEPSALAAPQATVTTTQLPLPPPDPQPERAPAAEPQRERITFDEHRRRFGEPRVRQRTRPAPRERPAVEVELQTDIRRSLNQSVSAVQVEAFSAQDPAMVEAMQRYLLVLQARLQAAFVPVGQDLEAEVLFEVSAAGRLQGARISRSSGDAAFDAAVLQVFRRIEAPGPPPGGAAQTFTLTFRSLG